MATRLVARSIDTLVILMGLRNLRKIMNQLLKRRLWASNVR